MSSRPTCLTDASQNTELAAHAVANDRRSTGGVESKRELTCVKSEALTYHASDSVTIHRYRSALSHAAGAKHAADVFYVTSHVVVEVKVSNPSYGTSPHAPHYVNKHIQFGPSGGFGSAVLTALQVLGGIPVKAEVLITLVPRNEPGWLEALRVGKGYESNDTTDPSAFPNLIRLAERAWEKLTKKGQEQALELDPSKGDLILARAKIIQELAQREKYLYVVTDKGGPILGSNVMGAKMRNCWGFVTDLFAEEFYADPS